MANNNLMVGLEIGTSKICVVVGETRPDGTLKILGVGQAPSRGVRKGEIVDFETAMKCVHEAVVDAEQKSDVMIRSVYVAIAGSHLHSFNNRGCVMLAEDRDEIDERDVEDVKINAREVSIPAQNAFLHSLIQHYQVDGQDGVLGVKVSSHSKSNRCGGGGRGCGSRGSGGARCSPRGGSGEKKPPPAKNRRRDLH